MIRPPPTPNSPARTPAPAPVRAKISSAGIGKSRQGLQSGVPRILPESTLQNFSCALVALLFAGATHAGDSPAAPSPVREEFRAALDRISQEKAGADSAALRAYVLYPYLEAARLRSELAKIKAPERAASVEQRARAF